MSVIKQFIELNEKNRITAAVVGDAVIDEYYLVNADRVSPEFPIPVMLSTALAPTYSLPGGAANVAYQFKHFNATCNLFSFLDKLSQEVFEDAGINARHGTGFNSGTWARNRVKHVPIKRRLYQGDFPLCRWDIEYKSYGNTTEHLNKIHNCLYEELRTIQPEIVILSDYDKGFFTQYSRDLWLKSSAISIVDVKKGPASNWKGCTIFKCNIKEAEDLCGFKSTPNYQCDYLLNETGAEVVIITDGGNGVYGVLGTAWGNKYFEYKPKKSVVANSVIGAGDCFAAFLALAYAQKMPIEECVEVAFESGAIYVKNKHNKPITPYDLLSHDDHVTAKFVKPESLAKRDFKLVFTNGCFDILHDAHIELLKFARSKGDKLVVAINTDASVRALKGEGRPINDLTSRMQMLSNFEFVDYIVPFFDDVLPLIKVINPDILAKGGDYKKEDVVGYKVVKDVQIFPYVAGQSTTGLIKKIKGEQ